MESPLQCQRGTLEHHCLAENGYDSREESIKHQELARSREMGAGLRDRTEALLERLLEGFRGRVGARGQAASPPKVLSAFSISEISLLMTSPRRRACCVV